MVPEGWKLDRLGNVAEVNPRTRIELTADETVAFLAMADVSNESRVNEYQIRKYTEVSFGFTAFSRNDVLVAKITPCFENGKGAHVVNLPTAVGFGSTEFHVIREQAGKSDAKFIHYLVNSDTFRITGASNMQGSAGQKRVPTDFLRNFRTLVPPLSEQQKIAEILGTWDKAIETTEALLANARTQKRALLQSLLTGTRRFPGFEDHPWRDVRLGDVCEPKQWATISATEMSDAGFPVYGANGHIGWYHQYNHEHPTIAVGCRGVCGSVHLTPPKSYITGNSMALDDINPHKAKTEFLYQQLIHFGFRSIVSGSAQPQITGKAIKSYSLRMPSVPEQARIAEVLTDSDLEVARLEAEVDHLRTEKKSLMQQLLTGKRRVAV